jgi:hypothetical protein
VTDGLYTHITFYLRTVHLRSCQGLKLSVVQLLNDNDESMGKDRAGDVCDAIKHLLGETNIIYGKIMLYILECSSEMCFIVAEATCSVSPPSSTAQWLSASSLSLQSSSRARHRTAIMKVSKTQCEWMLGLSAT